MRERDELGELLGQAVAEEIRRARKVGAAVVLNFEGFPMAVPATAVRLESDGPGPGIMEWCRREVAAHPADPVLMAGLRRIIPQETALLCWLCSVSGPLGTRRPLDVWQDAGGGSRSCSAGSGPGGSVRPIYRPKSHHFR